MHGACRLQKSVARVNAYSGRPVLNISNLIIMSMYVELFLRPSTILLIFESRVLYMHSGKIFAIMILTVAVVESAIGLVIMVNYYRLRATIAVRAFIILLRC